MCTVSWHVAVDAFTVFFNRDESRKRQPARPPEVHDVRGVRTLYPVDPEGGGTWLGVNTFGAVFCLLNFYDQKRRAEDPVAVPGSSRGQLLVPLLSFRNIHDVSDHLAESRLTDYRPFHVLFLTPSEQKQWTWNGSRLSARTLRLDDNILTTSSLKPEQVAAWRGRLYRQTVHSIDEARRYHYHQEPSAREFSVLMERACTRTVSISEIRVDTGEIQFTYDDLTSPPFLSRLKVNGRGAEE